jgi:hypothetical protein
MLPRAAALFAFPFLAACSPAPDSGEAARPEVEAAVAQEAPGSMPATGGLVPDAFEVPRAVEGTGFRLVPLGPEVVQIDYEAYMSSIDHLQETFTRSTAWPTADLDAADAMADMENEQRRFEARESFAYAVLTPDGLRERGCIYVRPSPKAGFDAMVRLWVTRAEFDAGFDGELEAWAREWVADAWPFERVAWPGRSIPWADWDAMPEAVAD